MYSVKWTGEEEEALEISIKGKKESHLKGARGVE